MHGARSAGPHSRTRMLRSTARSRWSAAARSDCRKHREIQGQFKSGNFSQDARGRWYCNIVCEVERPRDRTAVVGFDLGHKMLAKGSDGSGLEQARFYRDMERKLAEAERRGKTRLVKTINAKIATAKGHLPQILTSSCGPLGRGLRGQHLIRMADRDRRRQGDARRELVHAAKVSSGTNAITQEWPSPR